MSTKSEQRTSFYSACHTRVYTVSAGVWLWSPDYQCLPLAFNLPGLQFPLLKNKKVGVDHL